MNKISYLTIDQNDLGNISNNNDGPHAVIIRDGLNYHRKFPLGTPEDIEKSASILKDNEKKIPDEIVKVAKQNINAAYMRVFGKKAFDETPADSVKPLLDSRDIKWHQFNQKIAKLSEQPVYAYTDKTGNYYPITTTQQLKLATEAFQRNAKKMNIRVRYKVAQAILKRCEELNYNPGEKIKENLKKSASLRINPSAIDKLRAYSTLIKGETAQKYEKIAAMIENQEIGTSVELYEKLAALDAGKYATSAFDPFDISFCDPDSINLQKNMAEQEKIAKINLDKITSVLKKEAQELPAESFTEIEKAALGIRGVI
jgi:hypothetical protein